MYLSTPKKISIPIKTYDRLLIPNSSITSGKISKNDAPKSEPAENATRIKRTFLRNLFFRVNVTNPIREIRLTINVERIMMKFICMSLIISLKN